jgi:hypothetical protein
MAQKQIPPTTQIIKIPIKSEIIVTPSGGNDTCAPQRMKSEVSSGSTGAEASTGGTERLSFGISRPSSCNQGLAQWSILLTLPD